MQITVCEKVASMIQIRNDNLANALRPIVSASSSQSAVEHFHCPWPERRAWSNANAGAISWRCCRGSSLQQ